MMNNDKNKIAEQFLPRHTEYIRKTADVTGRSYRELEAEWKKAEREFDFDRMSNPVKYGNLKRTDGSVAQEISRRFEEQVLNPVETAQDELEETSNEIAEDEFGDSIENEFDMDATEDDMSGEKFVDVDDIFDEGDEFGVDDEFIDDESLEIGDELATEEEPESEGVPNSSLEQQQKLERPDEESATRPENVNQE